MSFSATVDSALETARKTVSRGSKVGRQTADDLRAEAVRLRQEADQALAQAEQSLRDEMGEAMNDAAGIGHDLYAGAQRSVSRSASRVEGFVQDRPVTSLAAALAVGLVIGYASRR